MPTKSKVPKPADPQQLILNALDRLTSQVEALVKVSANRHVGIDWAKPGTTSETVIPPRPTLKWTPLFTSEINWCVRCDPAELNLLAPGASISIDRAGVLFFVRERIGTIAHEHQLIYQQHTNAGAKFHAYLTTARQVAVKVGYPAQ